MKNKISFNSFNIISFLIIFIIVFLGMYYQYAASNKIIIENFQNSNYNKSFEIREKFRLLFDKLQYEFMKSEKNNLKKLDELYEIYKKEKHNLDLSRIESELNKNVDFGKYQVFLINKDYIIEKASYKKEIGFDLGQFKGIRELFDNLYAKKIEINISSLKIDEESNVKKYLIKLSDDEKYILQLGFSLDYNEEIKKQLDYVRSNTSNVNLYLATEFFVQEIDFKFKNISNFLEYNKRSTKKFLSELNLALKNKNIEHLMQGYSIKKNLNLNDKLEKFFPLDAKLLSYVDKNKNIINYFSSAGSLFGKSNDTILFMKTSFSLSPLNKNLNDNKNAFVFVITLVFCILAIFEYFIRKEIVFKIISIAKKMAKHEMITDEDFIIKDIGTLKDSYNAMLSALKGQIRINKELSYVDTLTQTKNRKAYNEKIEELILLHKRYKTIFSIAILDIDDFKMINDTYGHSTGDIVLKDITAIIKSTIRSSDILFRIGGEEFIIIFPHTALEQGETLANAIRKNVKAQLKILENAKITISIGLTQISADDCESSVFNRIDTLLYKSKNNGKDKVTWE